MDKVFILYVFVLILILISCKKDELSSPEPINRTIIVYMSADNDLSADALADIEEMKNGYKDNGVHVVVFVDLAKEMPCLLEIASNSAKTVKKYPEINSANASQMKEVLDDIIDLYPAHSYGLVLWSHATAWLPSGTSLRSFGKDHGSEMNITDLAMSLPIHFDFILFDACLMGSIEVAFELKDKTDYIIASSMETIYRGFPYDGIIPELTQPTINFKSVAKHFFDSYNTMEGAYRSATVSVIETRYLQELALRLRQLLENNTIKNMGPFDRVAIQRMDTYQEQYCFDLLDFINIVFPETDKSLFIDQLNKTVIYKAHTPMFLSQYVINTYCGLSCYIPHPSRNDLNDYYKTLGWSKASGMDKKELYTFQ